jgi:hypothetical protein
MRTKPAGGSRYIRQEQRRNRLHLTGADDDPGVYGPADFGLA